MLIKRLLVTGLVLTLGLYVAAEWFFNLNSNAVLLAVEKSPSELQVRLRDGQWRPLSQIAAVDLQNALVERYQEPGLQWRRLRVRRPAGAWGNFIQRVYGADINVLVISPTRFDFTTSFLPDFEVTTARERMASGQLWFCVNANFYEPSGKPMGWVWHDGRQVNKAFPEWSGVFFVKEGRPWFGPKSLLDDVPGFITEGAQVYPSVMKNHTVFDYVFTAPDRYFAGPKITYRSLAGMRQNGDAVFVMSGDGGVMNVREVTDIAHKLAVQHATLLDGGKALQYSIRTEDGPWHFTAFNTRLPLSHPKLQPQRSPVYLAVRPRPPAIRAENLGAAPQP